VFNNANFLDGCAEKELNETMFMMIMDNCWWLVMMIIWTCICLSEEYMYIYDLVNDDWIW
jgi:hypothetical protein